MYKSGILTETVRHAERGYAAALQKLYVAEYDLTFFKKREYMVRHLRKSRLQHPPGDEIYRNGNVSMVPYTLYPYTLYPIPYSLLFCVHDTPGSFGA